MPNSSRKMGSNNLMYDYTIDGKTPKKPFMPKIVTEGKTKKTIKKKIKKK